MYSFASSLYIIFSYYKGIHFSLEVSIFRIPIFKSIILYHLYFFLDYLIFSLRYIHLYWLKLQNKNLQNMYFYTCFGGLLLKIYIILFLYSIGDIPIISLNILVKCFELLNPTISPTSNIL